MQAGVPGTVPSYLLQTHFLLLTTVLCLPHAKTELGLTYPELQLPSSQTTVAFGLVTGLVVVPRVPVHLWSFWICPPQAFYTGTFICFHSQDKKTTTCRDERKQGLHSTNILLVESQGIR
jgi:hypothetical protein